MSTSVESGETSDKELGLVGNRIPVRTLKFGSGVGILLGEGGGIVNTNVDDDGCAERPMSLCFICECVWKRSYLSTRSWGIFCGRCFWWLQKRRGQKRRRGKWVARRESGGVLLCERGSRVGKWTCLRQWGYMASWSPLYKMTEFSCKLLFW